METAPLLPAHVGDTAAWNTSDSDWLEPTPLSHRAKESFASSRRRPSVRALADTGSAGHKSIAGIHDSDMPDTDIEEVERFLLRVRHAQTMAPTDTPVAKLDSPAAAALTHAGIGERLPGTSLPAEVSTGEPIPGARMLAAQAPTPGAQSATGTLLMPFLVLFIVVASVVLALELAGLWP